MLCWLPSYVGMKRNKAADRAVKGALTSAVSIAEVPAPDFKTQSYTTCTKYEKKLGRVSK